MRLLKKWLEWLGEVEMKAGHAISGWGILFVYYREMI